MPLDISEYKPIFYPQSLAIIGASDNILKFGGQFLRTTLAHGFKGKIYPVNPRAQTIQGLTAYPSLEAIPGAVDLAVITVPASQVMDAVKACIKKRIRAAEILSAGFKELGPEGEALEKEIVSVARQGNLRIIGPNCFGVYSPEAGLTLMPGADFSKQHGPVGFFSQSGGGTCDLAYMARGRAVYFSVAVSYGNGADIEAAEMLRYFEADPKTKIVGAYLEGVCDGREFFHALKSCCSKKPVVILKGGLSDQGDQGTLGHTGSMAGSKQAWNAAIKSAAAIPARDLRDLAELLMTFNCLDDFRRGGAGVLAGGGLRCVEALDAAYEFGFSVPELDPDSLSRIKPLLPPAGGQAGNPADLANPAMAPAIIIPIMEILAEQKSIRFLVLYQMLFYLLNEARKIKSISPELAAKMEYHTELAAAANGIREKTGKPLIVIMPDIASDPAHLEIEQGRIEARFHYTSHGIPCFETTAQAFSVLSRVADYYRKPRG